MNKMLTKQPRSEAIKKKNLRESMPVVDVQPTNPGNLFKIKFLRCSFALLLHMYILLCESILVDFPIPLQGLGQFIHLVLDPANS